MTFVHKIKAIVDIIKKSIFPFKTGIRLFKTLSSFNGIIISGVYPYKALLNDGYIQRIHTIDTILHALDKIYVVQTYKSLQSVPQFFLDEIEKNRNGKNILFLQNGTIIAYITDLQSLLFINTFVFFAALKCKKIYFHSIYRISGCLKLAMKIKNITSIIDFHGAVPEESRAIAKDKKTVHKLDKNEKYAVKNATYCITVTDSTTKHLKRKYTIEKNTFFTLPIFSEINHNFNICQNIEKYTCIYCGGTRIWQEIPNMCHVISQSYLKYSYKIYCTDPDYIKNHISPDAINHVEIETAPHSKVLQEYESCQYGFILRKNNTINNVACPTKLIEYIAFGIIPVVDSTEIGDFAEHGLKYVHYSDLLSGNIPCEDDRFAWAMHNKKIYASLCDMSKAGRNKLIEITTA